MAKQALKLVAVDGVMVPSKRAKKVIRNRARPSPRTLVEAAFNYARAMRATSAKAADRDYWHGFRDAMFDVRRILANGGHMPTYRANVYDTGGRVTIKHTKRPRS